jgi:hypothetical protein
MCWSQPAGFYHMRKKKRAVEIKNILYKVRLGNPAAASKQPRVTSRPWPCLDFLLFKKNLIFFLEVWRMGHGFWENGCTTPPFFEACPYTWKCYNFHSSWKLEISIFLQKKNTEIRGYLDLHIHHWDFCFMKKCNHKKFHKNC